MELTTIPQKKFTAQWEVSPDGKEQHFSWVTDIDINTSNIMQLMQGGRARWKIENETFNTLKNQGYNFKHNFGHGHKNLSTVLMHLMMLAFLMDQVQQLDCRLYKRALEVAESKIILWRKIRGCLDWFAIPSWDELYNVIINRVTFKWFVDTS